MGVTKPSEGMCNGSTGNSIAFVLSIIMRAILAATLTMMKRVDDDNTRKEVRTQPRHKQRKSKVRAEKELRRVWQCLRKT
eukprot:scaffold68999_cov19-Prasinocladus_malaysianus.AAC.1